MFKMLNDIKNRFCTDKGKEIQSRATPTGKEVLGSTVVVSNSVSKEFGVKETRSSSTLLAKALAKRMLLERLLASKKKWSRALRCQDY